MNALVMIDNSYDRLAPHYRALSEQRAAYLAAVEGYVVQAAGRSPPDRMLDAGAGDGTRARRIAAAIGVDELVLAEPSEGMAALARSASRDGETIWPYALEDLPLDEGKFGLITCLWNVLGHVPGSAARIAGLRRMAALLAPGGLIVIDVNNRHNAAAYGQWRVLWRKLIDAAWPDERRGDVTVTWKVGGTAVSGRGHLFTPAEVRRLVQSAGLRIADELAIDYVTGKQSRRLVDGQLVYSLEKADT